MGDDEGSDPAAETRGGLLLLHIHAARGDRPSRTKQTTCRCANVGVVQEKEEWNWVSRNVILGKSGVGREGNECEGDSAYSWRRKVGVK